MSDRHPQHQQPLGLQECSASTPNASEDDSSALSPAASVSRASSGFQTSTRDDVLSDSEAADGWGNRCPRRRRPSPHVRHGVALDDWSLGSNRPWWTSHDEQFQRSSSAASRASSGFQTPSRDNAASSFFSFGDDRECLPEERRHCCRGLPSSCVDTGRTLADSSVWSGSLWQLLCGEQSQPECSQENDDSDLNLFLECDDEQRGLTAGNDDQINTADVLRPEDTRISQETDKGGHIVLLVNNSTFECVRGVAGDVWIRLPPPCDTSRLFGVSLREAVPDWMDAFHIQPGQITGQDY